MTLSQLTAPVITELQVAGIAEETFGMRQTKARKTSLTRDFLLMLTALFGAVAAVFNFLSKVVNYGSSIWKLRLYFQKRSWQANIRAVG